MLFAILPDGSCLFVQPAELFMCFASAARFQVSRDIIGIENGDVAAARAEQPSFSHACQQGNDGGPETKNLEGQGKGVRPPARCGLTQRSFYLHSSTEALRIYLKSPA